MKKSLVFVVSILMMLSMILSACVQKVEETTEAPAGEELALFSRPRMNRAGYRMKPALKMP